MDESTAPPRQRTRWRRLARVATLALTLAPALAGAQRAELQRRILRQTLANGLEVIVVENHGVPLVTIEADVRNGSFTQGPDFEGLSHLYEHMFFKANADYPDGEEFMARASTLGAVFNGTTSEERVNYYLTLPADSIEGGMHFLASALRTPAFRADELEREREVVIGEYDRNESNPYYGFNREMGRALWGSAWSRKNPLGERRVILATTPERMRMIQQRYYVPNNTAIIIAGDVTPEQAFTMARGVFGDWKRGADPFDANPIPPVPPLTANKGIVVEEPIGDAVVVQLQWHGPSARGDVPATYAADVFSDVLNQPGSRFQRRLVDSGLFQSVGVNYYTLNQVGPITVLGETTPGKLRQAIVALEDELGKVVQPGYLDADALESVKQQRITGTMFSLERTSGFAQQLGFWWAVTGLDYFYGYVETMAKQTPGDLRSYAAKYIVGKPHVTGVLLSAENRRQLALTEGELAHESVRGTRP